MNRLIFKLRIAKHSSNNRLKYFSNLYFKNLKHALYSYISKLPGKFTLLKSVNNKPIKESLILSIIILK